MSNMLIAYDALQKQIFNVWAGTDSTLQTPSRSYCASISGLRANNESRRPPEVVFGCSCAEAELRKVFCNFSGLRPNNEFTRRPEDMCHEASKKLCVFQGFLSVMLKKPSILRSFLRLLRRELLFSYNIS